MKGENKKGEMREEERERGGEKREGVERRYYTPFLNNGLGKLSRGSSAGFNRFSIINSRVGKPLKKFKNITREEEGGGRRKRYRTYFECLNTFVLINDC